MHSERAYFPKEIREKLLQNDFGWWVCCPISSIIDDELSWNTWVGKNEPKSKGSYKKYFKLPFNGGILCIRNAFGLFLLSRNKQARRINSERVEGWRFRNYAYRRKQNLYFIYLRRIFKPCDKYDFDQSLLGTVQNAPRRILWSYPCWFAHYL